MLRIFDSNHSLAALFMGVIKPGVGLGFLGSDAGLEVRD